MTDKVFYITVAILLGAMALGGLAIAMPTAAPFARPQPAAAPAPPPQPAAATKSKALLDGCVIEAIGRLPKADGLRMTNSSYELRETRSELEAWIVSIAVDLQGRQATYQWLCLVDAHTSAKLLNMR